MLMNSTDELYIEAPPDEVYRALITFGKDSSWWPGAKTSSEGKRLRASLPSGRISKVSFEANVDNVRPDEGLIWWMDAGDITGRGEWWLEGFKQGTILHYYLEVSDGNARVIDRHRDAIRKGMHALKQELQQ